MVPELHCCQNPSPGQLGLAEEWKEVPSRGSPCSPALRDPFSEMPVLLGGRVRRLAMALTLDTLPSSSPHPTCLLWAGSSLRPLWEGPPHSKSLPLVLSFLLLSPISGAAPFLEVISQEDKRLPRPPSRCMSARVHR